ncbi:type VII secretion-associated serine protease mycosin [Nocardia sp. 2]|uniref:Type VII secretion-associated serine protease mycosin n=1 Tax=Nocardia acididurans TaxID=2802282 RepID=A0ABS1M3C5_9NOCA|nr:type VII secretion-associated serine protease mycosin [Nocardia acididurans]MBL1075168.1 type VII secretion-associated serine protease mycosin [Nocardia acididurans]
MRSARGRDRFWIRIPCAAVVLGAALFVPGAPASAAAPPVVDMGVLAEAQALSGKPAPMVTTEKQHYCAEPALEGAAPKDAPLAQRVLNLPSAWQFSRGAGQKVAVIDTGVARHPRLNVEAGGDYVSDTDGTEDCDGHGTLVAGIIAAHPSPDDAFVGVAPEAQILTIRQFSEAYKAKDQSGSAPAGSISSSGYGTTLTMAAAVVRAVDMGATVINISEAACATAGSDTADGALGAAVKYAYERNVVVVAAAGNVDSSTGCNQNEESGWDDVQTVATPAYFSPYVLSVGSVDIDGSPSSITLYGPWVGAAAVGRNVVSLDSKPGGTGLVNRVIGQNGAQAINGTSFAAPFVAGLAALVRAKYPELTAQQVMDRITRTAHAPGQGRDDRIGAGLIDPLAALTAHIPATPLSEGADEPRAFPEPGVAAGPDPLPRLIAAIGSVVCLAALAIGLAVSIPYRRRRSDDELPDLDS